MTMQVPLVGQRNQCGHAGHWIEVGDVKREAEVKKEGEEAPQKVVVDVGKHVVCALCGQARRVWLSGAIEVAQPTPPPAQKVNIS